MPGHRCGLPFDRHALRTTYITWMSPSGVEPRIAQQLAPHTDIRLTMQTYTDPRRLNTHAAVEKLPDCTATKTWPLERRVLPMLFPLYQIGTTGCPQWHLLAPTVRTGDVGKPRVGQ